MSSRTSIPLAGALGAAAFCMASYPAFAHTIVGSRVFPATVTIDDPGVNDELALPTFAYMTAANPDGSTGPISYTLGWEYDKTITKDLGISIGSEGITWQRNPQGAGVANIDTELKYVYYQDPDHEAILATAVNVDIAHTGSGPSSTLPSNPFTTITPKVFAGKGFGDVSVDWLRPIAVTGEVDLNIPTDGINSITRLQNPTTVTYGATLQYSLLYMNSYIQELPDAFKKLIPAFEVIVTTPVSNIGPSLPGTFSPSDTTGVFGPSLYYIGQYFELGVMAQIPINQASGKRVGALAILDIFLDDLLPDSLGKPLFGPAQSRSARY
jgi:hypothetical protein